MTRKWDDQEKALDLSDDGVEFCEQEKFTEALACYNAAILLDPENEIVWYNKGLTLYELDKNQEAMRCFDKAIRLDTELDDTWK